MQQIDMISKWIVSLLTVGAAFRVGLCLIKLQMNPDMKEQIMTKLKNTLVFMCIALGAFAIKDMLVLYFTP